MGIPVEYDEGWVRSVRVNLSAIEARVQTLPARRTFKKKEQAKAYLHAIACMDLTTLKGDDTEGRAERLCGKALQPVKPELFQKVLKKFTFPDFDLTVGAVCVYPELVETAVGCLHGRIPVASVATGFAAGQTPLEAKIKEVERAILDGAKEIDIVISRKEALRGHWRHVYGEVKLFSEMCRDRARMKTILGVGDLKTMENVAKASRVALMAGSDFIKTSTGFEETNATLETGLVMARQIREFQEIYDLKAGFKPAGGIGTAKDAMNWLMLMKEELGDEWTRPELFRFGASSLLNNLEMQLDHLATDEYSAGHRHSIG